MKTCYYLKQVQRYFRTIYKCHRSPTGPTLGFFSLIREKTDLLSLHISDIPMNQIDSHHVVNLFILNKKIAVKQV